MNKKVNLSEAAKEILDASVASKRAQRDGERAPHGLVGKDVVPAATAYSTKDVGKIGDSPDDHDDPLPDYTKGTPKATPPGPTPPVGSQPAPKLAPQPQETQGRADLISAQNAASKDESPYADIRDRKPHALAPQLMATNPGGVGIQKYESTELTDEQKKQLELSESQMKERIAEDIKALVEGENLSEAFVTKATTIFEAAVKSRAAEIVAIAETQLTEQFEQALEQVKEDLAEKVDDYLNYMVEEWMKENEIAIEKGLRSEIVEDFVTELRDLFVRHNINIPTEKVDVVEELTGKVVKLETDLNEEIQRSIELKKQLAGQKKVEVIHAACEGLTQTQVEKLKSLAESVEFTTEEEFSAKVKTLKESYFKAEVKAADPSALDEPHIEEDPTKKVTGSQDPLMEQYARAISKTLIK